MKSYFLRFRHVRGWYYGFILNNGNIENRIAQSFTSFFELRLIYWLSVYIEQLTHTCKNAKLRSMGMALWYEYNIDTSSLSLYMSRCSSQQDGECGICITSYHPHPNEKSDTVVYTEIYQNGISKYQLIPLYM